MSKLTDQMDQSSAWLRQQQHPSGGWGETLGDAHDSPLNTAECLLALLEADAEAAGSDAVKRAVAYLEREQAPAGKPDAGAWQREAKRKDGTLVRCPDVVRTGLAVQALVLARGGASDPTVQAAIAWLLAVRHPDGSWGAGPGAPGRIMPTCQALLGLQAAEARSAPEATPGPIRDAVKAGVDYLLNQCRRKGGFFDATAFPTLLTSPHTIYALMVLQAARSRGLITDPGPERRAVGWLLAHQDEARRLVAEEFELDPDNSYLFLYVTDSLLVRVLAASDVAGVADSLLYRAALYSVKDRIEPSHGGCYGYRLFTWSTARSLSAMSAVAPTQAEFPERPAEYTGRKPRVLLTGVMVAILVLGAVLGFTKHFSTEIAGLFFAIILVILVINGVIGEKTFAALWPGVKGGAGAQDGSG